MLVALRLFWDVSEAGKRNEHSAVDANRQKHIDGEHVRACVPLTAQTRAVSRPATQAKLLNAKSSVSQVSRRSLDTFCLSKMEASLLCPPLVILLDECL